MAWVQKVYAQSRSPSWFQSPTVRAFSATIISPPSKAVVYNHHGPPDSVTRSYSYSLTPRFNIFFFENLGLVAMQSDRATSSRSEREGRLRQNVGCSYKSRWYQSYWRYSLYKKKTNMMWYFTIYSQKILHF